MSREVEQYLNALIGKRNDEKVELGLLLAQIILNFLVAWSIYVGFGFPFWKAMFLVFGATCFIKIQIIEWWLFKKKNL